MNDNLFVTKILFYNIKYHHFFDEFQTIKIALLLFFYICYEKSKSYIINCYKHIPAQEKFTLINFNNKYLFIYLPKALRLVFLNIVISGKGGYFIVFNLLKSEILQLLTKML